MFFAAIGRLAVSWAHVEAALDIKVEMARKMGWDKVDPVRPRSLKRKVEYLKRFFKSLNMPDDGMESYDRLFRRIHDLAEARHDIIHGAVIEHAEDSTEVKFVRFLYSDDELGRKPITANSKTVMGKAQEMERLAHSMFKWIDAVREFSREQAQSGVARNH
ncbi:MAG: hypothetical protein CML31_07190 [Rhizobiales bacterium]|nr:hypothetical protein [Hyphomicrobiales bacterium]